MILQYFKKKETDYKKIADKIYINILSKSKMLIKDGYFEKVNFNSSFEIISILLIFNLQILKETKNNKYKHINMK